MSILSKIRQVIKSSVKMFADDVALYHSIQQEHDCLILQGDLDTIYSFMVLIMANETKSIKV